MTPEQEQGYWDTIASKPESIQAEVCSDLDIDECLTAIESSIPFADGSYVLDLGCGVGRLMIPLALKYPKVTFYGWDISQAMIDAAWLGEIPPNAYFIHGDGRKLVSPMGKGYKYQASAESFDAAYSMCMLQHIPPEAQRGYIFEVWRVLKPGGTFRFQFVEDGEAAPFSFPVDYSEVASWVSLAGFPVLSTQHGLVKPGWGWATATK